MQEKIKAWIAKITWYIFLWAIQMTKDEYWNRIYFEIEKKRRFDATQEIKGCKYCSTESKIVILDNGKKYRICSKCGNRFQLPFTD